jgi:hypothetical protein
MSSRKKRVAGEHPEVRAARIMAQASVRSADKQATATVKAGRMTAVAAVLAACIGGTCGVTGSGVGFYAGRTDPTAGQQNAAGNPETERPETQHGPLDEPLTAEQFQMLHPRDRARLLFDQRIKQKAEMATLEFEDPAKLPGMVIR